MTFDIRALAQALGGDVIGQDQILAPGPGHSARDRSLSIKIGDHCPGGFLVHSLAGDDEFTCKDYARARWGWPAFNGVRSSKATAAVLAQSGTRAVDQSERIKFAGKIWQAAQHSISGTPGEIYLNSRALTYEGAALRFHPSLRLNGRYTPGIVALMMDVITNEACGIQRIFLTPDGRRLGDKRMLGRARHAVVKLSPDAEVAQGLVIAEGIESALSALRAGWGPAWACLSAGGIAELPVLSGIEALTIFADNDKSGIGADAAINCARRWHQAGREVKVYRAPEVGSDANDVLRGFA